MRGKWQEGLRDGWGCGKAHVRFSVRPGLTILRRKRRQNDLLLCKSRCEIFSRYTRVIVATFMALGVERAKERSSSRVRSASKPRTL